MSIARALVTEDTVINIGQWVHGSSSMLYGLHSEPRQVTRIAGKRIHYKRQDGTESFMLQSAVLIVCDTEAEAQSVFELSVRRDYDMSAKVREAIDAVSEQYGVRLAEMIGRAQ